MVTGCPSFRMNRSASGTLNCTWKLSAGMTFISASPLAAASPVFFSTLLTTPVTGLTTLLSGA